MRFAPDCRSASLLGLIPGSRGSFMLDVVFLAMFLVVPVLLYSIYLARYRKGKPGQGSGLQLHKQLQIVLASVLLIAVVAFEIDMRFFTDWEQQALGSPYYEPETWNLVWYSLVVHLCFAIPTTFLWGYVIWAALRHFPQPPVPSHHSRHHMFWGRLAAFTMTMTAVTGWIFYWLAFIAT